MNLLSDDERLGALETPALVVDEGRMRRNVERLAGRFEGTGVRLRPHLKTVKCREGARLMVEAPGPATVSTLAEAEAFAADGYRDLVYAVGISPQKLERVARIRRGGCDLVVLLDSLPQAEAVVRASGEGGPLPALIEIDCDGKRGGLAPESSEVVAVGRCLQEGGAELRGVLTHAGGSYGVVGRAAHREFAERERLAAVRAAEALRADGLPCPVVSVGSSPTAHAIEDLRGLTEVRAGVYAFFDLVQAGLGVCALEDLALSVLTTVIGHRADRSGVLVDAGWMALSQDRGTAAQSVDQGYGLVCTEEGTPLPDLIVRSANQEHGRVGPRPGSGAELPEWPVGTRLRILPNHACATAAQFAEFAVLTTDPKAPVQTWQRYQGW